MDYNDFEKNSAEERAYGSEQERLRLIEKTAKRYSDEVVALIKGASLSSSENVRRRISGYICKMQRGSGSVTAIEEFPDGEVLFRPDGRAEYYMIESFGEEPDCAMAVCSRISSALEALGLTVFTVRPEARKFLRRKKYRLPFSKKPRYKVVSAKEKYVIYLDIVR